MLQKTSPFAVFVLFGLCTTHAGKATSCPVFTTFFFFFLVFSLATSEQRDKYSHVFFFPLFVGFSGEKCISIPLKTPSTQEKQRLSDQCCFLFFFFFFSLIHLESKATGSNFLLFILTFFLCWE